MENLLFSVVAPLFWIFLLFLEFLHLFFYFSSCFPGFSFCLLGFCSRFLCFSNIFLVFPPVFCVFLLFSVFFLLLFVIYIHFLCFPLFGGIFALVCSGILLPLLPSKWDSFLGPLSSPLVLTRFWLATHTGRFHQDKLGDPWINPSVKEEAQNGDRRQSGNSNTVK